MQSRNEDILTAIADGTSSSELKPPQSREEALLIRILDRVNDLGELGGKFKVHICTSSEYDHLTGIPTILGPEENTFYLVPSGSGTDMYKEWVYTNGNWELFGGGGGGTVTIPQSDWAQTDTTADDYIKNKPAIPAAQIQSDWNQTNTAALDYVKNKPEIGIEIVRLI